MNKSKDSKEWNAEIYRKNSQIQYQWAQDLLNRYEFKGNENVLDIGCGDGKITANIATKLPQGSVKGVDKSESMVSYASRSYPNIQFELQDAAALPFQNQFNLVFSCACLQWVKDQPSVLKGVYSSLKDGGRYLALLPNPERINQAVNKTIEKSRWNRYFEGYTEPCFAFDADEYTYYLERAKFTPISVQLRECPMVFDEREQFLHWLLAVLPLQRLPEEDHISFTNEIIDEILARFPKAKQTSGSLHIPMLLLEVDARKGNASQ